MDDHSNSQVDVLDDEFERLGRLAGAELRQPAPADGAGTVLRSVHRRRATVATVGAGVTIAVVVTGLFVANARTPDEPAPIATVPSNPVPEVSTIAPFVGTWVSTDTDGWSQTMEIVGSGGDEYEVVVRDDLATAACGGAASTMTGTGLLETDERLVIAQPELTCDDGTTPSIGSPPQAELADLTFDRDSVADELTDRFGVVWQREGSSVDLDEPATAPPTSGGMWPQATLDEVRAAQELADAGDPDYTWQIGAQLTEDDPWGHHDELELVDRFIREVLGWDAYMFNNAEGFDGDGWVGGAWTDQRFLRCAPGRTNPLYPPQPGSEQPGESCAPTLDDFNYESVSLDLAQLDRQGLDGIWVVNRWKMTAPFAQVDPAVVEAQARERLEEFLTARIAGNGAEGYVEVSSDFDVPLLYATTSGAPYERYEIERVDGPWWPYGFMTFSIRLFADADATVVEQAIDWQPGEGLWLDVTTTTENGQPVVLSYTSSDGEVSLSAPSTWDTWLPGVGPQANVWFGLLSVDHESHEVIGLVDPVAYDAYCAANGGSPLLSAPADAAAIAQQLMADPNFETTAPVAAQVGGVEAVSIDVALAPGGRPCTTLGGIVISRWIHSLALSPSTTTEPDPGLRLRLYLVDLPQGMSVQTLAITVVAPADSFEEFIAETAPIIESIEFHPG